MSGPLGSSQWMYNSSTGFYDHNIAQSLRFNRGDTAYLARTSSSTSSSDKQFTFSCWVKRGNFGSYYTLLGTAEGGDREYFGFMDTNVFIYQVNNGTNLISTQLFRDSAAWYHVVVAVNINESTASDRQKIYINGEQITSFSTANYYGSSDTVNFMKSGVVTSVGRLSSSYANSFDGYIAEAHFVDGSTLAPTSFGETSEGIWIPKAYSGSYGTNGFHLTFADSSALGDDTSGNGNDFTANNLAASDVVPDSPTNNFAVLNPLDVTIGTPGISEGNLRISGSGGGYDGTYATIAVTSGKWYAEFLYVSGDDRGFFGIVREDRLSYVSGGAYIGSIDDTYGIDFRARAYTGTSTTSSSGSQLFDATNFSTGDIGLLCFDVDAGKLWFGRRDVSGSTTIWYDSSGSNNGDPSAGSNPTYTFTATGSTWFIGCHDYAGTELIANFGQDGSFAGNITSQGASDENGIGDFNYIENGFLALCTSNLPDPTIGPGQDDQAGDYFNTVLYTGTGSSQSITGVGFQPDWVWIKGRSNSRRHMLFDSVRGVQKRLISDDTNSELTMTDGLSSFDSDGFTEGGNLNTGNSGETFVAWSWKAGGTAVSNSEGSLTCNVSANTEAGFSIVTWTANSDNGTLGHGLNSAPELIIAKPLGSGTNWYVMHTPGGVVPATNILNLDSSADDFNPGVNHFNDTYPTDTVFSYGGYLGDDLSDDNKVAYLFHSVDGFSKVSSYRGNSSTDGTFVYTGFRPAWLLVKTISGADRWVLFDSVRSPINPIEEKHELNPDDTSAEGTSGTDCFDFLSNGFKLRRTGNVFNTSGRTYIYMAFAEAPFKFANAR
jgi:predicted nucleic acid-binding protein